MTFAPKEILSSLSNSDPSPTEAIVIQVLGAIYFGFAMVNWTAKGNLIGGIYARPIAIGNLTHFTIGALALIKGYSSANGLAMLVSGIVYFVFAILFSIVFFTHPVKEQTAS